ncbi:glutaredoxin, partial [Halobacteriales archaeon QS_5_70_15]
NIVEYLDATYGPGGPEADEAEVARADGGE